MAQVTIEGTITPSVALATGERLRVERTGYINKLISGGFVKVVEEHGDPEPTPAQKAAATRKANQERADAEAPVSG